MPVAKFRPRDRGGAQLFPILQPPRALSTFCFIAGVFSILDRRTPEPAAHAERFGIFADKARPLPGLDPKLDEIAEKER